jgi:signal transduction histidine kinase
MKHLLAVLALFALTTALAAQPVSSWPEAEKPRLHQAATSPQHLAEAGRFFHRSIAPDAYGAHPQNWSLTQDPQGLLYVGNTDGVLVYDGVRWTGPLPMPNGSIVRSLTTGPDGRVYVGAENEFGVLRRDSTGTLHYVSLLDEVPPAVRDAGPVWRTASTSRGVFFLTYDHLFRWRDGEMRVWSRPFVGPSGYAVRDTFYAVIDEVGLVQVRDDSLRAVPGGAALADEGVYALLPYGDQGLLVATSEALFRIADGTLTPFTTDVDEQLAKSWIYHGAALPEGQLVLTTIRNGAVLLNPQGELLRHLKEPDGLRTNTVLYAYPDHSGGLWLGLEGGLTRVEPLSPLTVFDETTGFEGSPSDVIRHDGTIYLTTNLGVYYLETTGSRARFRAVPGLAAQCWTFASTEAGLLVGTSSGIYRVRPDGAVHLGGGPQVYTLHRSRHDPTRLYAGQRDGLLTLRLVDGRWQVEGRIDDLSATVRSIAEEETGTLWVGTNYEGLLRVTLSDDGTASVASFGEDEGLPAGRNQPFIADGRLLVATNAGLYRRASTAPPTFARDSVLARFFDNPTAPVNDPHVDWQGNVWMAVGDTLGVARAQADGGYRWDSTPFARLRTTFTSGFYRDTDGTVWVSRGEDVIRYVPPERARPAPAVPALIRRVATLEGDSLIAGDARQAATLPFAANDLHFDYAAPFFDAPDATEFRIWLDGFDDGWSRWQDSPATNYTNLPPGDYTFRVQARSASGQHSAEARFDFTIRPPWYRTVWAYTLYALGGLLLVAGLVIGASWWRWRRLQAQTQQLERLVAVRTREVERQKADLEALNEELAHTNQELLRTNDQKTELLGMTAHDLRNPLASIKGASQILLDELSSSLPQYELVDMIHDNADRMTALIGEILESVALESGRIELRTVPLDMGEVAVRAVENHRPQARRKEQTLTLDVVATDDLRVQADPSRLREMMSNLLTNAIKYSPLGRPIHVSVRRRGEDVQFAVRDEGPGLSETEQNHLFQPFKRLSPKPTAGEPSSGLGLSIVKQLIELHGGRVGVESRRGRGSTFTLTLPALYAAPAPREEALEAAHR